MLKLVLEGAPNKEIAARLRLAEQSVKEYVSDLLRKFDVRNRAALAEAGARLEMIGEHGPLLERSWIRQLFRSAKVMIAVTSGPEHRYVAVNETFARMVNRDVIGKTMREAFPELRESSYFDVADQVYATDEVFVTHELPATLDRGDGPELGYSDGILQAVRGESDEIEGTIYFGITVTEQVRARKGAAG